MTYELIIVSTNFDKYDSLKKKIKKKNENMTTKKRQILKIWSLEEKIQIYECWRKNKEIIKKEHSNKREKVNPGLESQM
jgi:hypothetical protein